ncbi:hybrid sensor histidine kinase/response regulator [Phenylobacterium sp.]|uniref:ATP-binding response regulator n=1 Tax=Phenylobacterium sp. TaxID=1871053 RepID=UPI002F3F6CF4
MIVHNVGFDAGLARLMAARRRHMAARLGVILACALVAGPLTGWLLAAGWFAACAGLQGAELALHRAGRGVASRGAALSFLAAESLVFGALAILALLADDAWGAACGGLFLVLTVFGAAGARRSSAPAFVATVVPLALHLLAASVLVARLSGHLTVAFAFAAAGAAGVAGSAWLWRLLSEALAVERRALGEADRRHLEADAAARSTAEFVAAARHALRRPLDAVVAGADSLGRSAPALRAQAERIGEAGRRAQGLLDDLRDLAAVDAGRIELAAAVFDLRVLVREAAAAWAAQARAKGLHLEIEGAERLPRWVSGDGARLRQVLDALLASAVRAADVGGVTLTVSAARLTEDEQRGDVAADWLVRLNVCDTGPGLGPDQLAGLFHPFDRSLEASPRAGAALTLSLGRALARLMGGDLYAASPAGRGAAFTLEVAMADARAAAPALPAGRGLRVLVADGQEKNRRAVALMLEPAGVQLTAAASAESALELLASRPFDLILMDVAMPDMDGREACRRLRAAPGPNRATPVIACAAVTTAEAWEDCRRAGMSALIAKPIDAAGLRALIAEVLKPDPSAAAAVA